MLNGLTAFVSGRRHMGRLFNKRYNSVRKLSAIEALSRYGRAEPKMLESIQFEPAELPTSALIDWFNILNRIDGIKDRSANLMIPNNNKNVFDFVRILSSATVSR